VFVCYWCIVSMKKATFPRNSLGFCCKMSAFGLYRLPTMPVSIFTRGRTALILSFTMIGLSAVSLLTGMAGKRYIYSLVVNLVPIVLPLVVREGTRGSMWGLDLLTAQCFLGVVYALVIIIIDSIVLAFISTEYKYCLGSWQQRCKPFSGTGTIDFICETTGFGIAPVEIFISCQTLDVYVMQFISLTTNLVHGVLMGPYLLMCQCMRYALARYHWENGFLLELNRLTAGAAVILGSEEKLNSDFEHPVPGRPVGPKQRNDLTEESRDEGMLSKSYITVTNRSALKDTSTVK